jgi:hypothetical protein
VKGVVVLRQRCRLMLAWGIGPRKRIAPVEPSAESAIHVPEGDSRFQRWRFPFHESWGVAPGSW